ncbi:MAG: MarR family transcriptional regulator [Desulfobacteraceae bacterium]|nr:MarR family transcriptional regulator [Desulfobacteraceae bacterium]
MKEISILSDLIVEFYEKLSSWEQSVVEGTGLTLAQTHTIEILGTSDSMKMKDLALKMGVTTGTLTVMIDTLENKGFVKRTKNPEDRRSYVIMLTEKGRIYYKKHSDFHVELTRECTSGFSESDMEKFEFLLREFIKNI